MTVQKNKKHGQETVRAISPRERRAIAEARRPEQSAFKKDNHA